MKTLLITIFLLSIIGLFCFRSSPTVADTSTANSPGTMADDATYGTVAWSDPDNAKTSNDSDASITLSQQASHYLKATNFGFSIPTGATINGILVEVELQATNVTSIDVEAKIVKSDGSIGSTDKAKEASLPDTDTYWSYGSSTELWGETWTPADINDADFGFVFAVSAYGATTNIDHIRMTVSYTVPNTATRTVKIGNGVKFKNNVKIKN